MTGLANERARVLSNEEVGPGLHVLRLESPGIAGSILPGQFVHMRIPSLESHILRRPFSVYACDSHDGTLEILYQVVGSVTALMPNMSDSVVELIGPVGNTWKRTANRALIVGGGVGAAPLFMLTEELVEAGCNVDVVLGAQTEAALVCRERYERLLGRNPECATDDGTYGRPGFCTTLVEERLSEGTVVGGEPYEYVAVCGPVPLMKIVAGKAADAGVPCEVSMEKRMACGVGACLSCVVDTVNGKRRSCVDGPIFDAQEVVWR